MKKTLYILLAISIFSISAISLAQTKFVEYDKKIAPGTREAWAMAADAVFIEINGEKYDFLGGWSKNPGQQKDKQRALVEWWGIENRQDLLTELQQLEEHGHRESFKKMGEEQLSLSDAQYHQMLQKLEKTDPKAQVRFMLVHNYYKTLGTKSIIAFDFIRHINLCRWGYAAGYITSEEAWSRIYSSAQVLQVTFDSWQDMSENYLLGRIFWSGDLSRNKDMLEGLERMKKRPQNPWLINKWDRNLYK